ncbi:MAG: hypothetical protein MZV64_25140 [Ignavibacteriales bacterium]|nr:hypothetical protein [Ignavibacteriales bacterium]
MAGSGESARGRHGHPGPGRPGGRDALAGARDAGRPEPHGLPLRGVLMGSNPNTPLAAPATTPQRWPALAMTGAFAATLLAGLGGVVFDTLRSPGTPPA